MKLDLSRPHQVYRLASGERVPGVTTVQGVLAKPALIDWSAGEERAGLLKRWETGDTSPIPDAYYYKAKRDKAADLGTVIHAHAQAFHAGETLEADGIPADIYVKSAFGFSRYLEFWAAGGFKLLASELQMVSERDRVGGTIDVLARDKDGLLTLLDLKSTKASKYWPYPDTLSQVSQYASMVGECTGYGDVQRIIVVRVGKEEGDELQTYELSSAERAAGLKLFLAARDAYQALKEIGR